MKEKNDNTMAKNYYPELPEIPYEKTKIDMPTVVAFGKTLKGKYSDEALAMALAIFRFESANGSKGVNNNYGGIQADNARWKNIPGSPIATSVRKDSGGQIRRFLCFAPADGYRICFELFAIKATERKMFAAESYYAKWVGNPNPGAAGIANFNSVLRKSAQQLE